MATVNTTTRGRGVAAGLALLVLTLLASACASDKKAAPSAPAPPVVDDHNSPTNNGNTGASGGGETAATTPALDPSTPLGLDAGSRYLIVKATVGVQVDDVGAAVNKVVALAARHGGQVFGSNVDLSDPTQQHGQLVLQLPPDQVEATIADLAAIGKVTSRSQNTSDATNQVVDLDARILTAQAGVDRVRALVASAKDIGDVIALEGELTKRETELEQLTAQEQSLKQQAAQSTLTVELAQTPKPAVTTTPTKEAKKTGIGDSFARGGKAFVNVLAALLIFVGYTAPFLAVAAVVTLLALAVSRRRPRNPAVAPLRPPAPGAGPRTTAPDSEGAARIP